MTIIRGDQGAITERRESFKNGLAQFERDDAERQLREDLTESGELVTGASSDLKAEQYNYAAAVRDGEDLTDVVPAAYLQPGAMQLFGRDVATNTPVVDPAREGYIEEYREQQTQEMAAEEAQASLAAVPVRIVANATLDFIEGLGELGEDITDWHPLPQMSLAPALAQLAKLKEWDRPEALEQTTGFFEDMGTELLTFLMGYQAAPLKLKGAGLADEVVRGAQAAQVLDPEEGSIGSVLADVGLLPDVLWFLDAKSLAENDHKFMARLSMAVEEGALTATAAAIIGGVVRTAKRIQQAEGDSLIERGFATLFQFGPSGGPRARQRGSLDVSAGLEGVGPEDVRGAAPGGQAAGVATVQAVDVPSPRAEELDEGGQKALVDMVDGYLLKGASPEQIHRWADSDGFFTPEQVDAALVTAQGRRQQAKVDAPGSAAGPQQVERLNTPPSPTATPAARSTQLVETEEVRPIGPVPGSIDAGRLPPEASADEVARASGAGLLPTDQPVLYQGKDIPEWTPEDWQAFGQEHGVERLGPLTELVDVGEGVQLPGGLDGEFTFIDMMWLKAQGYDPRGWPDELKVALQKKLSRTNTPEDLDDVEVFNRTLFGMLSPNQPLTANEFEYARMRARSVEDIQAWANMIDWEVGAKRTSKERLARTAEIGTEFGTQAGAAGGMGLRSTSDLTSVAEFAQLFLKDPSFFRKKPDESWQVFVERVSSQARGLSSKVASFGLVWQDPLHAAVSAVDRHMAQMFKGELLRDPKHRAEFEAMVVKRWNTQVSKGKVDGEPAQSVDEVVAQTGGRTALGDTLMTYITRTSEPKLRTAKGEINPRIPEELRDVDWVLEPEQLNLMGEVYMRALAANDALAQQQGLHLFSSQWMLWDSIRGRVEPHETMFPGLYRLPKPSQEQMQRALDEHKATGFVGTPYRETGGVDPDTGMPERELEPVRESKAWERTGGMKWWEGAYFSILPMLGAGGLFAEQEDEGA